MLTIGLLGGMSWESTQTYYQLLNEGIKQDRGGLHSAKIILNSLDFADIEALQHAGDWPATADILTSAAQAVERAGADFLVICTNTMHKVAPAIQSGIKIPILHIADATALALKAAGIDRVGLLGTRFTMEQDFYKQRLIDQFGIDVIIPDQTQRDTVHSVIYNELCLGTINPTSRQAYLAIIESLSEQGAQAIILGCTEIALLVKQTDTSVPLYDTTEIHAKAAISKALGQ
ncbi:aspartate/glutamate racemase family protein [Neptunomonas phycophila]|uniref:aspartate/glutamate racemase family protein n=1 Tax=Neptunomonas phycophila TaxID=1572645 RepID=UPI001BEA000E|nr:aspartate/glutamate racemase family protein [Neptunomonas phycophila]MBT3144836.1 aspartate/glutamate racemase family protein [Neptunomonas phycophila]